MNLKVISEQQGIKFREMEQAVIVMQFGNTRRDNRVSIPPRRDTDFMAPNQALSLNLH
jgi:hypothetical protein